MVRIKKYLVAKASELGLALMLRLKINYLPIFRLLLCLGVYEKNLISISKLIFKLTRCENNDAIFLEEKTVHSLLNVLNQQKV